MQLVILDANWLLIPGIHNTGQDLEQMTQVNANFVFTPTSEAIRGGGIGLIANAKAWYQCELGAQMARWSTIR